MTAEGKLEKAKPGGEAGAVDSENHVTINDLADLMGELRGLAYGLLRQERSADSIRPTALVISALRRYKLSNQDWHELTWESRSHFFKSSYMMMRRALIDHARKRNANGRPKLEHAEVDALDFYQLANTAEHTPDLVIALDEALSWLSSEDHELSLIVQHHYFSGFTVNEIATVTDVSEKTIKRRLALARMTLERKVREILAFQI